MPASAVVQRVVMTNRRERDEDNVRTAADGTFSMRVKEGSYDFAFKRDGYAAKAVRAQTVSASTPPLQVTLEPGVEVSGRVTRGGAGVEGVTISVIAEASGATAVETAPDGSFTIGDLNPGSMMIAARKPDEFIQITRPITAPVTDLILEVPPGGTISGRVVDKTTKQPVTNFQAGITPAPTGGMIRMMGPPQFRSFTSDDGTFTLENVPVGTVQLNVQAAGYTAGRVAGLTVEEGKPVAAVEVLMDRGAKVTGRVTGPDGSAMAGVAVRVEPKGGNPNALAMMSTGRSTVVTDGNGDYTIEAVEKGEKTVVFARQGYLPAQKTVALESNEHRVDAQLSSGVRISGQVVTEGGAPIAEAGVMARSATQGDFGSRSTQTDASGNFTMEGLSPGRYSFMVNKRGLGSTEVDDVDVSTGTPVRIVVKSGGTIYGRVIGLTADELGTTTVSASSSGGYGSAAVDANGNYRIEGAPTGTVRLGATTRMGLGGGKSSPQVSVQLEPGGTAQQDIEFKSGTIVSGRVTRDGRPVSDAMIGFFPRPGQASTNARTTTDRDGYYEVTGLEDASYTVSVTDLQRNVPYTATYEVRGSGTFNVDMKAGVLRGRVTDASTGEPISEAMVELRTPDGAASPVMRAGMSDAAGAFTIEGVTAGKYYVSAEKEGYGTKIVDLTAGDSSADLEMKLTRNPGVTLRVVDARDGRLISARVRVTDAQNRVVFDSPFRFGGSGPEPLKLTLEAGSYRATVTAQGYASQTVQILSPSTPTVGLTPGGTIAVRSKGSSMRRARIMSADGREYFRGFGGGVFTVDPSPGITTLENIAPGVYTIQILGSGDQVESSAQVNVGEGQRADVEI
jgi:protocatechuate 3,4-dioxygenase beta subunit